MAKTTRWTGGHASSNNWSEASNWDNGVPVAGDTLEFAGTTRLTPNNNIAADTSFAAITFISGAGAFTIGGNRITMGGAITNNDDSLQTISLDMIFDATRAFSGGGNIDVTGVISGAGGLQKNDTGTLTLSSLNTYTGITLIVQGTLSINTIKDVSGGSSAVGAPTSVANGTIEMQGFGATLKYTGSGSTTDRVVYMNGGAGSTFSFDQSGASGLLKFTSAFTYANGAKTIALLGSTSGTGEISGSIANTASGAVSLTKTGTGTWTLSASNTYSGGTTVSGGTLNLSATSSLPADSNLIVSNATVNTIGSAYSMINNYNSGTITINAGGTVSANNTALNNHNIFDLVMNGGTLAGGTAADAGYGHFELLNSISATDTSTISAIISGKATRTITVSSAKTLTISGALQNNPDGNLAITKAGTGTLTLSVVNSFTGAVIVNAGTISTTAPNTTDGALGTASGITINSGGTISATGDNSFVGSVTSGAKTITINSGGTLTSTTNTSCHLHAVVMNGGTLSATTARADYANWNPDYGLSTPGTGSTTSTISGGNIALTQTSGVVFNIGSGDTVNVTSIIEHATIAPDNGLIKSGTGTLTLSNTNTYTGGTTISAGTLSIGNGTTDGSIAASANIVNDAALIYNNTTSKTYANVISGSGTLTKSGAGTLTLSGTNTFNGTTTISAGTLKLTKTYSTPSFAISSGAVLEFDTSGGNIDGGTATFSGAGTLKKSGAGSLFWSTTAATFALDSGSLIDVQAGTFTGGSNGNEVWTNNKSDLNVESGAIFDGVEANIRVNKLTGAGTIKSGYTGAGYTAFTFGVDNGTGATFTGVLADSTNVGNYIKAGTGKQTCTGTNTFTGNLTIDAGGTYQHGDASNNGQLMAYNAGNIIVNGAFIRYIDGAGSYGFVKTMSGSGTFEKAGSGTWVLAVGGVGSYSGTTTVSAGDLRIEGAITGTGAVTVANGATLSGTGTLAGAITVSSGGTAAPGTGGTTIGTLSTANVTFNATSIYSVNLDGTTPTFDKINSSGTVALGAAANTLTVASIANSAVGKVYTIIGATSLTGTFAGLPEGYVLYTSGRYLQISYLSNTCTLTDIEAAFSEHTVGRGSMRGVGVGIM